MVPREGSTSNVTFEEWLAWLFDHPVTDPEWYWDDEGDWWQGPPATTVRFLTRLFSDPATYLATYSDAQVNQGLWFVVSDSVSGLVGGVLEPGVPWPHRQRCIRSVTALFEECFAARCTPHFSHFRETHPQAGPLNVTCYMWWDLFPSVGDPDVRRGGTSDAELLTVLTDILAIDHIACQESALHGLGHWQPQYPDAVAQAVDSFLGQNPDIPEPLRDYAERARTGCVL